MKMRQFLGKKNTVHVYVSCEYESGQLKEPDHNRFPSPFNFLDVRLYQFNSTRLIFDLTRTVNTAFYSTVHQYSLSWTVA
jgi:hypothetical protein